MIYSKIKQRIMKFLRTPTACSCSEGKWLQILFDGIFVKINSVHLSTRWPMTPASFCCSNQHCNTKAIFMFLEALGHSVGISGRTMAAQTKTNLCSMPCQSTQLLRNAEGKQARAHLCNSKFSNGHCELLLYAHCSTEVYECFGKTYLASIVADTDPRVWLNCYLDIISLKSKLPITCNGRGGGSLLKNTNLVRF